jgi:hypothetical protein
MGPMGGLSNPEGTGKSLVLNLPWPGDTDLLRFSRKTPTVGGTKGNRP